MRGSVRAAKALSLIPDNPGGIVRLARVVVGGGAGFDLCLAALEIFTQRLGQPLPALCGLVEFLWTVVHRRK